jgi:hypothetical protein
MAENNGARIQFITNPTAPTAVTPHISAYTEKNVDADIDSIYDDEGPDRKETDFKRRQVKSLQQHQANII